MTLLIQQFQHGTTCETDSCGSNRVVRAGRANVEAVALCASRGRSAGIFPTTFAIKSCYWAAKVPRCQLEAFEAVFTDMVKAAIRFATV